MKTKIIYSILIAMGAIALTFSIIYSSSILAFIGLGLTFLGIILAYIQTEEYVKRKLLDATTLAPLLTLNKVMQELQYEGKAVYLPPKYFKDQEENRVYIPKQKDGQIPTPEQIQEQENKLFIKNPNGLLLTPPGAELTKLFEKILETTFTRIDLRHLQQIMPKLFIEDLEIAQNLKIETKDNRILVEIKNSVYKNLNKEVMKLKNLYPSIGCPLVSAFACTLARATGKPIVIEKQQTREEGKVIEIEYRIVEEKTEQ